MAWLHFSRTARNLALSAASTWYLVMWLVIHRICISVSLSKPRWACFRTGCVDLGNRDGGGGDSGKQIWSRASWQGSIWRVTRTRKMLHLITFISHSFQGCKKYLSLMSVPSICISIFSSINWYIFNIIFLSVTSKFYRLVFLRSLFTLRILHWAALRVTITILQAFELIW